MPVFTNPVSSQNTSYSAGVRAYPQVSSVQQYLKMSDEFRRETLNPTNGYALYTSSAGAGSGSAIIISANQNGARVQCSNATNDNTTLRTSGLSFTRTAAFIDQRTQVEFNVVFFLSTATNVQFFIGLLQGATPITALPTTARHLGVFGDTSGAGKFILSSSNGTTQVKTNSRSLDGLGYRLQILWTGDDLATLNLYGPSNFNTLLATQTVTSLANASDVSVSYELQFFIETLTTSINNLNILEWSMSAV